MTTKISCSSYCFPPEIIQQAIWLSFRFALSFREVEDLLAERGVLVFYETVRLWVNPFGPRIEPTRAAEGQSQRRDNAYPATPAIWSMAKTARTLMTKANADQLKAPVSKAGGKPAAQDNLKSLPLPKVEKKLGASPDGLTQAEVQKQLSQYGPNEVEEKKTNEVLKFLTYFWGPIPWMIEAAVILSAELTGSVSKFLRAASHARNFCRPVWRCRALSACLQ